VSEKIVAFLCHPVRGRNRADVLVNLASAKWWVRAIEEQFPHVVVLAPWIYECEVWDDSIESERIAGLERNKVVITRSCDVVYLADDVISAGMLIEATHAKSVDRPLYHCTRDRLNQISIAPFRLAI
jgi:hypothetical protein